MNPIGISEAAIIVFGLGLINNNLIWNVKPGVANMIVPIPGDLLFRHLLTNIGRVIKMSRFEYSYMTVEFFYVPYHYGVQL